MKSNKKDNSLQIFKALSVGVRLDIILLLASGEKCVCDIYKKLKFPQNLISHHLGILRESNLIVNRKDGKWVHYSLNRKSIGDFQELLTAIITTKEKKSKC